MMNLHDFDSLAQFCAEQYYAFDVNEWLHQDPDGLKFSTLAAFYLSQTSWYGHEMELEQVASLGPIHGTGGATDIDNLIHDLPPDEFDLARFSARVRYAIALRRMDEEGGAVRS